MLRWLKTIVDVRKGEVLITLLMVFYIYLVLVTYYLLKPARDSLFIAGAGPEFLPLVFVLIAVVVVPVTTLYSKLSNKLSLNQLINTTTIIIIANLFILRWMLTFQGEDWVFYVFYIWVSIYGALTTSQFWLLANAIYDATQAKRIFGTFSLAAILGAFSGGGVTTLIVTTFGVSTEDLLYFCVAFLAVCIPLVNLVWARNKLAEQDRPVEDHHRTKDRDKEKDQSWAEMFRDIKASRHLRLIMAIIAMTMATASFVDYQFKFISSDAFSVYEVNQTVLDKLIAAGKVPASVTGKLSALHNQAYESREQFNSDIIDALGGEDSDTYKAAIIKEATSTNKDAFTGFLGQFYGGLSLLGFLFQAFFNNASLRWFGVGGSILFLPISQILASIGMLFSPNLTMAILLRGSDGTFKYSIDKTGRELLFLPIPLAVKKRSKVFIDLFIDRIFRGISGLVLLYFTFYLELTMRQLSMVVLGMVTVWIIFDLLIRKEYVNAFRMALDKGEIDPEQIRVRITDASTAGHLIDVLDSGNERQISYALAMLTEVKDARLAKQAGALLSHDLPEIRRAAVEVMRAQDSGENNRIIESLISDTDSSVRAAAFNYILEKTPRGQQPALISDYLGSKDYYRQSAALGGLSTPIDSFESTLVPDVVLQGFAERIDENAEEAKVVLARFFGATNDSRHNRFLPSLNSDPAVSVVRAAITEMGRTRDSIYIPELLKLLPNKLYRRDAREALACYGGRILGTLNDYIGDASVHIAVRKNIPRVMLRIPSQASVDLLSSRLGTVEPVINHTIIQVLNRLRTRYDSLEFDPAIIEAAVRREAADYYQAVLARLLFANDDENSGPEKALLLKALGEKRIKSRERAFRLLALIYPSRDLFNAYLGVISENRTIVASGIEFLENMLPKQTREFLMPMLHDTPPIELARKAERIFGLKLNDTDSAIINLLEGQDPWIKACSILAFGNSESNRLQAAIAAASASENPIVKETANLVLLRYR